MNSPKSSDGRIVNENGLRKENEYHEIQNNTGEYIRMQQINSSAPNILNLDQEGHIYK